MSAIPQLNMIFFFLQVYIIGNILEEQFCTKFLVFTEKKL